MVTVSMAAADSEWIDVRPSANGMRERPFAMSSASATRTTPASSDSGSPSERCEVMHCSTSAITTVLHRLLVQALEHVGQPVGGHEQAPVLVAAAVHGHADAVPQRAQHDDHLGVLVGHAVVVDHPGLGALAR